MFYLKNTFNVILLQKAVDFITVCLAFSSGYWFYTIILGRHIPYSFLDYFIFAVYTAVIFLVFLHGVKLYEKTKSLLNLVETRNLLWASLVSVMLVFASTFYYRAVDFSRLMLTFSLVFVLFCLALERSIFYRLQVIFHRRRPNGKKVLIYGATSAGAYLLKRIYNSPAQGLVPLGFLDDDKSLWGKALFDGKGLGGCQVLGGLDALPDLVDRHGVKEIFIALPKSNYKRISEVVDYCRKFDLLVSMVFPAVYNNAYQLSMEEFGSLPVLRERRYSPSPIYLFVKRVFDISFSVIVLLICLPLVLFIVLAIKLSSPGPVFFVQERIGKDGKKFKLYKFRTMYESASPYQESPGADKDPRITRVGRKLRKTSLDELPQFLNVIKGDMSIVGPRPEMPFIVESYHELHRSRLMVRPGITGVWQISAVRTEAIHENIEYDLFYIENQSLLLDTIIISRTMFVPFYGSNTV